MAFHRHFRAELAHDIPKKIEVATDNNLIDGVLVGVEGEIIRVVETTGGYAPTNQVVLIPIAAINFVRILTT